MERPTREPDYGAPRAGKTARRQPEMGNVAAARIPTLLNVLSAASRARRVRAMEKHWLITVLVVMGVILAAMLAYSVLGWFGYR